MSLEEVIKVTATVLERKKELIAKLEAYQKLQKREADNLREYLKKQRESEGLDLEYDDFINFGEMPEEEAESDRMLKEYLKEHYTEKELIVLTSIMYLGSGAYKVNDDGFSMMKSVKCPIEQMLSKNIFMAEYIIKGLEEIEQRNKI